MAGMSKMIAFGQNYQVPDWGGGIAGSENGNLTDFLEMLVKKNIDCGSDPGDGALEKTEERQGFS
jgi:hypothetical protein